MHGGTVTGMTKCAPYLMTGDVVMLRGGRHQWIVLDELPDGTLEITTRRPVVMQPGQPRRHVPPLYIPASSLVLVRRAPRYKGHP